MISRRGLEAGTAALTLAFGVAVAVSSYENGVSWSSAGVESGTFPFITGLIVTAASAWNLVYAGLWRGSRHTLIARDDLRKIAALFLPALAMVVAVPLLGLHVASAVYMFGVLVWQNHIAPVRALAGAVVVTLALYALFDWAFQVTLPRGALGAVLGF
jgi:hypothetical protein